MKRKVCQVRLSPNEEARLIREELERRRKLRIQQVREQQRCIALQIRRSVEQRRQHELEKLGQELREDWERQQSEKLHTLQTLYQENLELLGQGHRSAKENEPDLAAIAQKEEENHTKAEERYREALRELKSQRLKDQERQSRSINARKMALQTEKIRASKVASLPPPPPKPLQNVDFRQPSTVRKSDVSAFTTTHYHMLMNPVDREVDAKLLSAHEEAELEVRRLLEIQREQKRKREEHLEKARLRGKQALKREHLIQDRERLLVELEHMQQTDLLRRRQQVSQMPPQIFQPFYKRQETREDFQREMEFAFEDMYTGERGVKGDLVVQLVPEPLPAPSTGSQDQELDVTLDEVATWETENTQHDTEQEAESTELETSAQVEPSKPAPRRALKKLLDRIRSQRNQWTEHHSHVPAADSPTAVTDQIPERDTTIDTGSLHTEGSEKLPPSELLQPADSPAAMETMEPSAAAETFPPEVPANRIQEFTEERSKREEELEREKQQQVVLLQELEEQKAKLEQMLLEAQQEREHLKAALTQEVPVIQQEVPIIQPEVPVRDHDVTSVTSGLATELVPPSGEDDHTRRIREYQQRLLEQNRTHQRSVEVARQRLEEYQRALQIRYKLTTTSSLPAVVPPSLIHPPLHRTPSVHLPTPLQIPTAPAVPACIHAKPQTSVEIPTRETDMLASPPHISNSSGRVCPRLLPDEVEPISSSSSNWRPEISAWLTDNIMERVTDHLPERVRPSSVTKKPLPHKLITTHHSMSFPLGPTSNSTPDVDPGTTDVATLVHGYAAVNTGTFPLGPLQTESLSFREDDFERQSLMLQQRQQEEKQRQQLQEVRRRIMEQKEQEEERQRLELQEVQRRMQEQREAVMLQQRQQEEERQRRELQEVQRRIMEQEEERQRLELQEVQRRIMEQEEERQRLELQRLELQEVQQRKQEQREAVMLQQEEERQRLELQEVQRRMQEQREAVMLQQEEERQRREVEMEQMRRQKEMLQALIHTDAQSVPETTSEVLVPEDIGQTRRQLLVSLLKAIEENNGGTLSHLENLNEKDRSSQEPLPNNAERDLVPQSSASVGPSPASLLPSGLLPPPPPPPRAAKPPVTRIRLGIMEMMTEQHELSAIQEVETPVNSSQVTGLEDRVNEPPQTADWDPQEESESLVTSDGPSWCSIEQRTAERPASCGTSSGGSNHLMWRERLLMGAETSPESSGSDSVPRISSPLSSDSGRGADFSGPAITSYRSITESALRPPDSDCLSSTTISTGSYITTDPELNVNTGEDKSSPLRRVEQEPAADLIPVSSPSAQSLCAQGGSAGGHVGQSVDALFNDSSIQQIIDKYTRELNISLSTTGRTTDSEGSHLEEPSDSHRSVKEISESKVEDEDASVCESPPSDAAGAQRRNRILDHLSTEDPSLAEEQNSFRPLIGQLADQSSMCLAADRRDSAMERLVGQPSAHSSMIGQLPVSVSLDQGGWDSTLSRMIGRLSHQSSSHWLSGGQDFYASQLMGQMVSEQSTTWLDESAEESRMRPLVGELDESAEQHSGGSGERTHMDPGVSAEVSVLSYPMLPPEASSHSHTAPSLHPHPHETQQDQTSSTDQGPERTEDLFHTLLAEVTHNETAYPSMVFHPPEHNVPNSPERSISSPSGESETNNDPSVGSEPSPERMRTEEPSGTTMASPAFHESFSQLLTSEYRPHESVLTVSPHMRTDVELTALSLSAMTISDEITPVNLQSEDPSCDVTAGLKFELVSDPRIAASVSEKTSEAACEKGILEQSEITLMSLTDTTVQDQETTVTDEEGICEDRQADEVIHEGQRGQETEVNVQQLKSNLSPDEAPEEKNPTHPVTLLELQWDPSRGQQEVNQQKRRALLQRSSQRVEQIRAKRALTKTRPENQSPSEAKDSQPVNCKEKTKAECQQKTNIRSKGGQSEQQTEKSGFIKQKQQQLPSTASDSRLKKEDEMKICTPQQRKLDVSEMHQRTQRLYEQLEEVKHQKEIRSRQEAYAKNRLKAKEFHQKTLQKLRAKKTMQ